MQRLPARDNDRLALGADNAINEGAILEDQHCGNALNAESGGSLRVLVNVSFATE